MSLPRSLTTQSPNRLLLVGGMDCAAAAAHRPAVEALAADIVAVLTFSSVPAAEAPVVDFIASALAFFFCPAEAPAADFDVVSALAFSFFFAAEDPTADFVASALAFSSFPAAAASAADVVFVTVPSNPKRGRTPMCEMPLL